MIDISMVPPSHLNEIAEDIKQDTLNRVNETIQLANPKNSFYTRHGKRMLDFFLSLIAVFITLPINLVIGIVTFFDVGTPLIFKQSRIGRNRKPFTIYKFRNMTNERDANGDLLHPRLRVTKWGKFVRRTSLDELMNFISILKGDMSFIGPRPLISTYAERLNNRHLAIYSVRPGLECPFPKTLDHAVTWQDRLDNYVWYTENVSFFLDLKLIFRIVKLIFSKEESVKRSTSENGSFLGYDENGKAISSKALPKKYVERYLARHGYSSIEEEEELRTISKPHPTTPSSAV